MTHSRARSAFLTDIKLYCSNGLYIRGLFQARLVLKSYSPNSMLSSLKHLTVVQLVKKFLALAVHSLSLAWQNFENTVLLESGTLDMTPA
jgi:hypothetical protein